MCCITDILIYYFSPISHYPMQAQSNPTHSTNTPSTPFSPADLAEAPLTSLKLPFCQWIRCLPMEQRFLAAKINVPGAAQTIKRILSREGSHLKQHITQQRLQNSVEARRFSKKHQKAWLDSLVLVCDGHEFLDHICFDFALLEYPQKLFELLVGFGDEMCSATLESLLKRRRQWSVLNQNLYKMGRDQMSYCLFLYLRQEVLVNFAHSHSIPDFFTKPLEEEKRRKKELSSHWKFLCEDSKERLLLLGGQEVEQLCQLLQEKSVYIKSYELQKQIEELLKLQKNQFCNRIFKCKLKKVLSPLTHYYHLVYQHWKKDTEKARKKRGMKYNRTERDYNSQQKAESAKQSKQKQMQKDGRKYKQGKRKGKNRKSNSLQSNETNETEHSMGKKLNSQQKVHQIDRQQFQQEKQKQQSRQQVNPQYEMQEYTKKSQSTSSTASTKLSSKQSEEQASKKREIQKQRIRKLNIIRLNSELEEVSDRISEEANQFHDRRIIAFQRIQFLLQYYNVSIKLFGSCASGIAVRNSDIDIAIDNSILMYMDFLPQHQRIKVALEKLQELFITQPWITQIKFIKTAAIPLIKLTVNTQLPFLDPSIGPMYFELNREHNFGPINADITVQTKNKSEQCSHLGLISTNAINKWLSEISCLHSLIIILKEMFGRRKLNCTYQGGLNTFSMIVLIVAYIYHAKLEQQENTAQVFQKVLRFYSQQFDEKARGIDLLNRENNNIFYIKNLVNIQGSPKLNKQKADLQIKDPMSHNKNMTRNCYSFPQIKSLFQLILEHCFKRGQDQIALHLRDREQLREDAFGSRNVFIEFLESMEHTF